MNVGGSHRAARFLRYFPEHGIETTVFALDPAGPGVPYLKAHIDDSLLEDFPESVRILRLPSDPARIQPSNPILRKIEGYFRIHANEGVAWEAYLKRAMLVRAAEEPPDVLLVTAPPFSMVTQGVRFARRLRVPLVLDMRDPWSTWVLDPHATYAHYRITLAVEGRCFKAASNIVLNSEETREDIRRLHPSVPAHKFHVITNGYSTDVDSFAVPSTDIQAKRFTIGYVGSFYYLPDARERMMSTWRSRRGHRRLLYIRVREDWKYRSPWFFFRAVRALLDAHPELSSRVEIRIVGAEHASPYLLDMVEEWGLQEQVHLLPTIDHSGALRFQASCDALLITSSKVIDGRSYSIAGKTFEYLVQNKPIVAFTPKGAQKALLEKTGLALFCDPDAPERSAAQLYDLISGNVSFHPNEAFLRSLHVKELAESLAGILHTAAEHGS